MCLEQMFRAFLKYFILGVVVSSDQNKDLQLGSCAGEFPINFSLKSYHFALDIFSQNFPKPIH